MVQEHLRSEVWPLGARRVLPLLASQVPVPLRVAQQAGPGPRSHLRQKRLRERVRVNRSLVLLGQVLVEYLRPARLLEHPLHQTVALLREQAGLGT